MIRARAKKVSKNVDTYVTDLRRVSFVRELPKSGKPMWLLTGKMSGGVRTSKVRWLAKAESKQRVKYFAKTYNSTYVITIYKEDLEGEG